MQVSQADAKGCKRLGVEEHLIKFRPSPNFKNMKKFIKSKMDHIEIINRATPNAAPDPPPPPNIGRSERVKPEVQPPLPLDPPPPDSPIYLNMQVKQEIEDTEYQSVCDRSPELEPQQPQGNGDTLTTSAQEKSVEKAKMPICRDYIRGTCKRQGTCKFAHKYDVSQLEGVYTFCHKYQNSVCTFANCKYVHADVFEERQFYRTGILPPHALAHHKKVLQPPPPPPPPEEPPPELPAITFPIPPPPLQTEIDKSMLSIVPSGSVEARFTELLPPARYASPLKREWSTLETFGSSACDIDTNEHLSKKCKHCDIMEFRLQYNKDKVEKMRQGNEDMGKKMNILEKKNEKLYTIIMALVKPQLPTKSQSHTNGLTLLNGENKDKSILEQLNAIMSVTSRLSTLGEDK